MDRIRQNIQRDFTRVSKSLAALGDIKAKREARELIAWIKPQKDARVLDAACGPGTLARALTTVTAHVAGLDLVPRMICAANKAGAPPSRHQLALTVGRVERLPYRSRQFDLVICAYSFANFPHPVRALEELARVTRRTGRIVVVDVLAPENSEKCARLNRLEALRGNIYTRIMRQSEFLELFNRARLRLARLRLQRHRQSLRDWLRLSPAATNPTRAQTLRKNVLDSVAGDKADLQPRRIRGELVIHHSTAWFLLRHR